MMDKILPKPLSNKGEHTMNNFTREILGWSRSYASRCESVLLLGILSIPAFADSLTGSPWENGGGRSHALDHRPESDVKRLLTKTGDPLVVLRAGNSAPGQKTKFRSVLG